MKGKWLTTTEKDMVCSTGQMARVKKVVLNWIRGKDRG